MRHVVTLDVALAGVLSANSIAILSYEVQYDPGVNTFELPQFDPTWGQLKEISLRFGGTALETFRVFNDADARQIIDVHVFRMPPPNYAGRGPRPVMGITNIDLPFFVVPAHDEVVQTRVLDYYGYWFGPVDPSEFGFLMGVGSWAGNVTFAPWDAIYFWDTTLQPSPEFQYSLDISSLHAAIDYRYEPIAVPEPSYALIVVGLGAAIWRAQGGRRTSSRR